MKTALFLGLFVGIISFGALAAPPLKLKSCINQNQFSVCAPPRSERCQKVAIENELKYNQCLKDNGSSKAAAAISKPPPPKAQPGKVKS